MRFHIRAASATSVETPLQPGIRTILMGSVYRRSYNNLVASPGSHWKDKITKHSKVNRTNRWRNEVKQSRERTKGERRTWRSEMEETGDRYEWEKQIERKR